MGGPVSGQSLVHHSNFITVYSSTECFSTRYQYRKHFITCSKHDMGSY